MKLDAVVLKKLNEVISLIMLPQKINPNQTIPQLAICDDINSIIVFIMLKNSNTKKMNSQTVFLKLICDLKSYKKTDINTNKLSLGSFMKTKNVYRIDYVLLVHYFLYRNQNL